MNKYPVMAVDRTTLDAFALQAFSSVTRKTSVDGTSVERQSGSDLVAMMRLGETLNIVANPRKTAFRINIMSSPGATFGSGPYSR